MLPKRQRLHKRTIEEELVRAARMRSARFLVIYARKSGSPGPQISFTASKKIAKQAVVRNKLRRRGYAAVAPLIPFLSPEALILVSYTKLDTTSPISEITLELKDTFQKARLLVG